MKKVYALCLTVVVCAVINFPTPAHTQGALTATGHVTNALPDALFVPGEMLIQFDKDAPEVERASARALVGALTLEQIETEAMRDAGQPGFELVTLQSGLAVLDAARIIKDHPSVVFAEPNWIYTHEAVSNDPYYTNGSLYSMYGDATTPANQYGSQAGEAWAAGHTGSSSVYVGVIDEGVQFDHPDLASNVWTNQFDPVDGVDNDGNGFVDDTHGWDFDGNNNTVYDGTFLGLFDQHGTHVSGTIGARGGNGVGVAGVNWNVTIISAKFLGVGGGTTANAVKAIDYITNLKTRHGLNIVATNNSWGGGGASQALLDAMVRGARQNILFIAAAGNDTSNNDATMSFPANYNTTAGAGYDAVISVASINSAGAISSFSNYGATTVDLGAPGDGIYSTMPRNKYGSLSGTSMATPHVTGGAALYASTHPGATAQAIRSAILGSVVPTASLNGKTATGGRLNVSGF
ncbi:MAG TPA: S8 family peptidase [Pyrinomonadaceae bacterium]|nr:S8 family peptidase [Pyrinomonadaceae bacterium]